MTKLRIVKFFLARYILEAEVGIDFAAQMLVESSSSRGRFGRRGCHTDLPSREVVFLEGVLNLLSGELSDDLAGVLLFIQVAALKIVIAENAPPIRRFAHAG